MTDRTTAPALNPALVFAHARAWIDTPHHAAQSARGAGCDCVGLIRGVYRELTGQSVAAPGWRADWAATGAPMLQGLSRHLIRLHDPRLAVPGLVATYRVGSQRAAHVGIAAPSGLVHLADYAGRVVEDAWPRRRVPSSLWAMRAPVGCVTGPSDLRLDDCRAVILPDRLGGVVFEVLAPDGARLARSGVYPSTAAALDILRPIYPHIETP